MDEHKHSYDVEECPVCGQVYRAGDVIEYFAIERKSSKLNRWLKQLKTELGMKEALHWCVKCEAIYYWDRKAKRWTQLIAVKCPSCGGYYRHKEGVQLALDNLAQSV